MDGRGSELNEGGLSGCAGAEPKIGDVIEIGLTALDAGLPLRTFASLAHDLTQMKMAEQALRNSEKLVVAGRMAR